MIMLLKGLSKIIGLLCFFFSIRGCAGQSSPQFDASQYNLIINQNPVMNTAVLIVSCAYTGSVEYGIIASSPAPLFLSINSLSGEITLTLNANDIAVNNYTVSLQCSDASDSTNNDLVFLTVSRVEENQFVPEFLNEHPIRLSISESRDFIIDPTVVDIDATDGDLGTFGSIVYTIQGDASDTFSIDSQTGLVSLQANLDFEAANIHQFIVTASNPLDPRTGTISSVEILVIVEVTNINDEPPVFSEDNYQQSVHETFVEGGFLRPPPGFFRVQCIDLDTDQADITYSIDPDSDPGPFVLDAFTGSFSVTADLDYETRTSYFISVVCFDNGFPNQTDSTLVDITVSSVNEFEPEVRQVGGATFLISETIPIGTIITSGDETVATSTSDHYEVIDQDTGPDGNVTYTLSDNNNELREDAQFFSVDLITGSLIVVAEPDVDSTGGFRTLVVVITACDSHPPRDVCPNIVKTFIVLSADEHQPTFSQEDYDVSYSESTPPITTLVTAACQDGDSANGMINGISFINPAPEVENTFYLDPDTGDLVTIRSLDFEAFQSYGFELSCTDNIGNEDRAVVRIDVVPENDNEPSFQSESYEFFVSRTTPPNRYPIGSVLAIDEDIGVGGEIVYMFTEANGFFDITNDGVIELFSSVENHTESLFQLEVEVSDGPNVDTAEVLISLTAGNFIRPEFVVGSRAREVSELSPVGTSVISVLCSDTEEGENGDIRYSIVGGNTNEAFQISPIAGIISVADVLILPQNSSIQEYLLDIRCEDQGTPILSDDTVIFIRVFQDDSNPPEIGNETVIAFISEDAEINDVVTVIEATDLDSEVLRFRLENESNPNVFQIDPSTGSVFVAALLNRELVSRYEMVVVVTEVQDPNTAGPERSDTAELIIFIRDVNDNIPVCENVPPVTIPETLPPGSIVVQLNCSDADSGENGDIQYAMSNDFGVLSINPQGEIVLENPLGLVIDINTLVFTVNVADQGIPQQLNSYSVTVFISSTNRNIPSFVNLPATIEVSEAHPIQETIFTAQAFDPDRGVFGEVSYQIINSDENEPFTIFPNTGAIVLTQKLNFFERPEYSLNVSASDSDFTVTQILTVLVLDANEYTPECAPTFITTSIAENLAPNQLLSERLSCSDNDDGSNGDIVFRIRNGNEDDALDILSNGSIVVLQTLDFETVERYELVVEVSDSGSPPLSVNVTVVVIVIPVNEHSPIFSELVYTAIISEDANLGMSVVQVSATDDDLSSHPHGQVVYMILDLEELIFSISSTGLLQVAGNLDREQRNFYSFTVRARDQGLPPKTDLATILINITDADDNAPRFSQDFYIATLNLATESGAPIIALSCSDLDVGINGAVTFSFDGSSDSQLFEIQPSGQIIVISDLSTSGTYSFTAFCIGLGPANFSDVAVVSIQVLIDSNIRFYPSSTYNVFLTEDTVPVLSILQVNATTLAVAELTYMLLSVSTPFSIDETTGVLRLIGPLDYETTMSYALRVRVTDDGSPPNVGEALVQVVVENVNDEPPQITTVPPAIILPEGPTDGPATIGQYTCTDEDEDVFGQVAFRIESGNEEGLFVISESGTLQLIGDLDYETTQSYTLQLTCEDGGVPARADTVSLFIAVSPVNDNAPMFTGESIEILVTEVLPLNSNIGPPIQATDADLPPHNDLHYSIISGNGNPSFFAISSTSGQLTLVESLDFELISSFTLVILAQDSGGQVSPDFQVRNDTLSVTLTVLDFNDNTPQFSQQIYTGTVQETASVNDQVELDSQVVCTDADSDSNGAVTLEIANGDANDVFAIQDSGIIIVQKRVDSEEERSYRLEIECRDNGSPQLGSQATVLISVLSFNEFGPVFNQSRYLLSVSESTPVGTQIGEIFAVDQDTGEEGIIVYSLAADTQTVFTLDPNTGGITLIDSLDYETQTLVYILRTIATDSAGLNDVATVIIQVQNADDNLPEFSQANYFASVPENAEPGTFVAQVSCSDADDQAEGVSINYFLTDSGTPFVTNDGRITVAGDLDLEVTPRYTLDIICTDSADNVATATITINLDPFNDFPPFFTGELPYTLELEENAMIGIPIFGVTAIDDDAELYNDITFTFTSGNDAGRFEIDSRTGIVTVSQSIDREEQSLYVLEVFAQNVIPLDDTSGSEPLSAITTLTITVLDTNDNDPTITPEQVITFISEANAVVEQFLCSDPDLGVNGTTTFSITDEDAAEGFEILSDGTLLTTDAVTSSVVVEVTCFDNGTPQRSSRATVIIQTVSMNDHSPVFPSPSYQLEVAEDHPIGQDIQCFEAVDMDGSESPDGFLQYSLSPERSGAESKFGIRENTGCIFVSIALDFNVQNVYRYDIIAQDRGDPPLNGTAVLVVDVLDTIRDPPVFVNAPYTRILSEGVEVQTFIADATCIDQDSDDIISYSITGGNDNGIFSIDNETGVIILARRLDYEASISHSLLIECTDSFTLSDSTTVFVTVTPVNEFTPAFQVVAVSVPEHSIGGTLVTQLEWMDADTGPDGEVTFNITSGNVNAAFVIINDGRILVAGVLDRETLNFYVLEVQIRDLAENPDERRSSMNHVNITISDINDHSPEFLADPYTFGPLLGSELPGHMIGTVQCIDMDTGTNAQVAYNIPAGSGPEAFLFSVDSESGNVSLVGDLDLRQVDNITFFVECIDAGSRQRTGSTRVLVSVVEVNGHPPVFMNASYSITVPEDTRIFEDVLLTVEATDRDTGVSGRIQYSLQDDFNNLFFINEDSGELSLLRTLDFETRIEYVLIVQAIDGAVDSPVRMSSSANVTIEVSGVNEHPPVCLSSVYIEVINRTSLGEIIDLECSDDDEGSDGDLVYSVLSGDSGGLFTITPSGRITIPSPITPDTNVEQYVLEISIADSGNPSLQIQVEAVLIYSFENLAGPVFNQTIYYFTTSELAGVGTILGTIEATDADPSLQGQITYSVTGTDRFRVHPTSGEIFVFKPLDHETHPSVQFTIIAEDNDPIFPQSGSALVNITVQNENDNLPICGSAFYQTAVLSTAQVSDTVLALDCSDPDGDVLVYRLSVASSSFAVDETMGVIYVAGRLTPSTTTVLNVLVTDSGENSIEVAAIIQVSFANSMPPAFTMVEYVLNVAENTVLFSNVGSISATDADSSPSDLTYTIDDPEQNPEFYVVANTGDVILTSPLDHENVQSYSFIARVRDSGSFNGSNQLSDIAIVTVNVVNANDNLPQLSDGGIYGATLSMDTAVGTTILRIRCTDGDAPPYGEPAISDTSFAGVPFDLVESGSEYTVRVSEVLSETAVYTIDITCTDAGGLSAQGQAFIWVPDLDAPVFGQSMYKWTLNESASSGSEYSEIVATSSDGSDVTYSFTNSIDAGLFYINPSTGTVSLVGSLDYETGTRHSLTVTATDGGSRQSSVLLLVVVLDESDFVPGILPSTVLQVAQNAPIGYPIGVIDCSDEDSSFETVFNFAFVPVSDTFSVDEHGTVRLVGTLDATPVYALTVNCYDTNAPDALSTGLVIIEVEFFNQYPPVFDFETYVFSVREDADVQSLVGIVQASDRDLGSFGELSYAIIDGNPDTFYVSEETGSISLLTALDREDVDSYLLTLEAVDGGLSVSDSNRMTGTAVVYILVEDVNDNPPVPDRPSYIQSISTSHAIFTPVLSIQCTDSDLPGNAGITYSLEPDIEHFAIQSNGTILLVREQSAMAVHNFNAICTDSGSPVLSSSSLVTVLVDTVEASAPEFEMEPYEATISEEEPIFSTVLQVRASSSDSTLDIVYTIDGGNGGSNFQINPTTGDIILVNSLDASQQQRYTLTIQASYTGRNPLASLTTVDIMVTDVNNNSPVFSTPFYTASINESIALLTPVIQLECTDADVNAEIFYEIDDDLTTAVFNITREGLVTVASEVDYETETVHTFQVTCTDGGDAPRSSVATVRIEVLPLNDFIPSFSQSVYEFTVPENAFGLLIGSVQATDSDLGSQGRITYHLLDPGDFSLVFVEPSTGDVLVATNLDYEAQSFWNLTVIARDGAGAESHAFLEITVTNVNDVEPVISPQASITSVPVDSPPGFPLRSYSCTDADDAGTVISILNGNSLGYFELNEFNQLVWTGSAADLTSDAVVSLTIQCQDIQDPEQRALAYIAITIRVGDAVPPEFSQELYQRTVSENTAVGMTILTVSATSDNEVLYELFNLPVGFPFSIDEGSGSIFVSSALNREMTLLFVFAVRATDEVSGAVGLALIEITIGDVNDNVPVLLPLLQSVTLPEDLPLSTPFLSFACSDEDTGINGEIDFQIINSSGMNTFRISENGIVELVNPLDFEVTQNYSITVVCTDAGDPSQSASASLLIAVTGINEYAPQFDRAAYSFTVDENVAAGEVVGVVSAFDGDAGVDGDVRFEIIFGSIVGFFSINSVGEIRTTIESLNATLQDTVELIVRATDGGLLSNEVLVTINIADVNEPPVFPSGSYVALTSTDRPPRTSILEFICYDTDLGDNARLSLTISGNPSGLDVFIDTENGVGVIGASIITNSTIAAGAYELLLRCSDGGNPQLHAEASVTVRVEGVNTQPVFSHGSITISVSEDTQPGTLLVSVNASDAETGVTYAITGGNSLGTFSLDSVTGDIFLTLSLDYETTRDYGITVTATDEFIFSSLSSSTEIFVFVFNTNDLPPLLSPGGFQVITVSENAIPVSNTISYACTDPDGGMVNFFADPPNGPSSPFGIAQSGSTGTVQLLSPIDFELQTIYTLMVTCTDTPIHSGDVSFQVSATLIIHVLPVNSFNPEFVSPPSFNVSEDASSGDVVARVQAVDGDNRGQVTYSSFSHTDLFLVDQLSGNITLVGELDYEDLQMYILTIEASDNDNAQGVEPRVTSAAVEIRVTDTNDNRPVCTSSLETVDFLTGTYAFSSLLQLTCSDIDGGQNSILIYSTESIQPSILAGEFVLNDTTGELGFTGTVTLAETIVIQILVSDSGDEPLTTRVTVIVQVESSDFTQPRFEPNQFSVTISENTERDTTVLNGTVLQSALSNPLGANVQYIQRTNPLYGNTFTIDSATGDIILSSTSQFDFDEGLQEYSLIVEALVGDDVASAVVSVTLTDYNDNAPRFEVAVSEATVQENQANGTFIVQVQADDIDSDVNGEFRFMIEDSVDFAVDPLSGQVITLRVLDRERQNIFTFVVFAIDLGSPQQTGSALVSITVGDENDVPPRFASSIYSININNLSPPGAPILTFDVIDEDITGTFAFRIITEDEEVRDLFTVDSVTRILRQRAVSIPEDHAPQYQFMVEVNDEIATDTTTVVIYVFSVTSVTAFFVENTPDEMLDIRDFLLQQTFNITVNATYEITGGDDFREFNIVENGVLRSINALDRENIPEYSLSVAVQDLTTSENVNVNIRVVVVDQNDNAPVFLEPSYRFSLQEGTYREERFIGTVNAIDVDEPGSANSLIEYSLVAAPDEFSIEATTGRLCALGSFDRETNAEITFTVRARDFGGPDPAISYVDVTVQFTDTNDNNPRFEPPDVLYFVVEIPSATVPANTALSMITAVLPGDIAVQLQAFEYTDPDSSSVIRSSLEVIRGENKYELFDLVNSSNSQVLLTTAEITTEDNGTVLQIALHDEPLGEETNPISREVRIISDFSTSSPSIITPTTGGQDTQPPTFFETEFGIAVIVVICVLILALILFLFCLSCYCCLRFQREKDPLSSRDRTVTVAQRIFPESERQRRMKTSGRPWEYYGYSDIDQLDFPEFSPDDPDTQFLYRPGDEYESSFMDTDYDPELGYAAPYHPSPSTGTSVLSSTPREGPADLQLDDSDEEDSLSDVDQEECAQDYSMGPILVAMLEEWNKGDKLLEEGTATSTSSVHKKSSTASVHKKSRRKH